MQTLGRFFYLDIVQYQIITCSKPGKTPTVLNVIPGKSLGIQVNVCGPAGNTVRHIYSIFFASQPYTHRYIETRMIPSTKVKLLLLNNEKTAIGIKSHKTTKM